MRLLKSILIVALMILLRQTAHAAATEVKLLLAADTAQPGDTVMAGLHFHMPPNWHIYWRNPGIGIPPTIQWQLPAGVTAGEIQWPVPSKLSAEGFTTYDYENDVVLLIPLSISTNAKDGPLTLKGRVDWQECSKLCVNVHDDVSADLTVGTDRAPSFDSVLLDTWKKKLPLAKSDFAAHASWAGPAKDDTRDLLLEWPVSGNLTNADFYPFFGNKYEVQGDVKFSQPRSGVVQVRKIVKKLESTWPDKISGLLIQKTDAGNIGYEVDLPIAEQAVAQTPIPTATSPGAPTKANAPPPAQSLPAMLLYAFIGGLILNVMPCVLPVIALKILGFVNQAKEAPARVRKLGLVYTAGVLVSFLALATVVILVKSLGHAASWGMQFQNPQFLIAMTVLVTLVALNLFGVFEINLGGRIMGEAGTLASREGYEGAFFNGVLATVLATPCTAPFLGVALGFAFTQPAYIIVLMFLIVGLGLAAPYVILSWEPAWLKFLPRPGVWMEKFKIAMGFPMLATAVWLYTLVITNFGQDSDIWLGLFLVLVALSAWVWGQFVQRGRSRQGLAIVICLAILIFDYAYLLEGQLHWRHPVMVKQGLLKSSPDGIDWQPWSPEALKEARASGRPVLVDFTAQWCFICLQNKKTSIEIPRVREKLKAINAIALEENSFTKDATVVAELNRYQRAGVPLVLVYPKDPNAPPQVLPELLTPGTVLDALDKAAAN